MYTFASTQKHAMITDTIAPENAERLPLLERIHAALTRNQIRKNLVMTVELSQKLDEIAIRKGTNVSEIMRRALDLYLTVDEAAVRDKMAVGLVKDPKKLDTLIVGL